MLVGQREKDDLDQIVPIVHKTFLPEEGSMPGLMLSTYFWGLAVLPLVCFLVVLWNHTHNIVPISEALECLCFQRGERCLATPYFSKPWWDDQWRAHSL